MLETVTVPVGLSGRVSFTSRWAHAGTAASITTAAHAACFFMTSSLCLCGQPVARCKSSICLR